MSKKIRELEDKRAIRKVVHIGGVGHIYSDYNNLFKKLKNLNPIRMKVSNYELIYKWLINSRINDT